MLFPPQPVRIALALVVLWAPLCSHAGLQLRYYPNTGSSPNVADWREAVLDSSDIVEARPSTTAPAVFTVMRALHGSLRKAAKLPLRCAGIEMETSPEETLRDLLRAPIVDHVLPDHTLPVDEVEALAQYSTPSENATYLLAIVRHRDEVGFIWRFPLQTVGGDMLLLQDGLAYIAVPVPGWQEKRHEPRLRHVWVPHPYMPKRSDLERVLDEEINFKDGFLRDLHRADKQLRIEALRRYVDSTDVERKRFVYAHRAVEAIAATGAVGTAYLREQSATPPFANYLWSVVDEQRKQHDRAAVPWLRQNIEHAMRRSPSLSWPRTYCYSDNEASLATLVFLCQGAQTLAALGDDQGVRFFIRASIAWQSRRVAIGGRPRCPSR